MNPYEPYPPKIFLFQTTCSLLSSDFSFAALDADVLLNNTLLDVGTTHKHGLVDCARMVAMEEHKKYFQFYRYHHHQAAQ